MLLKEAMPSQPGSKPGGGVPSALVARIAFVFGGARRRRHRRGRETTFERRGVSQSHACGAVHPAPRTARTASHAVRRKRRKAQPSERATADASEAAEAIDAVRVPARHAIEAHDREETRKPLCIRLDRRTHHAHTRTM